MRLPSCSGLILLLVTTHASLAQLTQPPKHSLDLFARNVFEAYQKGDFATFYQSTLFSLDKEGFKTFLLKVKNDKIRNRLTDDKWSQWKEAAYQNNTSLTKLEETWRKACLGQWRKIYYRLKEVKPSSVQAEAFSPILKGAERESIQWKTTRLKAIEVFHEVSADQNQFIIDGEKAPILYWEPGLTYRLRFDQKSLDRSFRFSTLTEGPIPFQRRVLREKTGYKDLVAYFPSRLRELYYFCPRKPQMGNRIRFSIGGKDPRRNVLITFEYGVEKHSYGILLRDCLPVPAGIKDDSGNRGWLLFDRPLWLGRTSKDSSIE